MRILATWYLLSLPYALSLASEEEGDAQDREMREGGRQERKVGCGDEDIAITTSTYYNKHYIQ